MQSMESIIAFILCGGRGSRIYPMTKERSKPAIPFGGSYRIIDIPISNCMNSRIYKIFVLTQFNSKSLNQHINRAYRFDHFNNCFVDILPAEQTLDSENWYQGTADAIRRNLKYLDSFPECDTVYILSGDQIYNMDLRQMYHTHLKSNADVTIATTLVPRAKVKGFGIMKIKEVAAGDLQIIDFIEKPSDAKVIDQFNIHKDEASSLNDEYLASMGIYLFKKDVLIKALKGCDLHDFGKEIIPQLIKTHKVVPYIFNGYWEDIGTIKSFHQANLDLLGVNPKFIVDHHSPIYTNSRFLPPPFCAEAEIKNAMFAEGVRVYGGSYTNSIIGVRGHVEANCQFENVLMMGSDWQESKLEKDALRASGKIPLGVGKNCIIKNAIIDKNARIGDNVQIVNKDNIQDHEDLTEQYFIKEGIVVIPKGTTIADNTII